MVGVAAVEFVGLVNAVVVVQTVKAVAVVSDEVDFEKYDEEEGEEEEDHHVVTDEEAGGVGDHGDVNDVGVETGEGVDRDDYLADDDVDWIVGDDAEQAADEICDLVQDMRKDEDAGIDESEEGTVGHWDDHLHQLQAAVGLVVFLPEDEEGDH